MYTHSDLFLFAPVDMGARSGRKRSPWSECFEPYTAADYQAVVGAGLASELRAESMFKVRQGLDDKLQTCRFLLAWYSSKHFNLLFCRFFLPYGF